MRAKGDVTPYSCNRADGTVVALICDDRLYVKILAVSHELEAQCEQGAPYPGAKPHYLVDEGQLSTLPNLPSILLAIAKSRGTKKKPTHKAAKKRS